MCALADFYRAIRNSPHHLGLSRHFFRSGLVLAGAFVYLWAWSGVSQWLTGDNLFAIGKPIDLMSALNGGGIVGVLMLVGFLWLFMTGFAARGAMLRERDRRIAELEAQLAGRGAN